jgi:hypothetical protein
MCGSSIVMCEPSGIHSQIFQFRSAVGSFQLRAPIQNALSNWRDLPDVNANKFSGPRVARRWRILTDKSSLHIDSNDVIFNNLPPRMVIKEMRMHMATPEACFQATTADQCQCCDLPDVNANKFSGPRVARRWRILTDKSSLHIDLIL